MPTKIVLGLQFGDEGKGKVVDQIVEEWADVVVRFQGGDNAGHTIYDDYGHKFVLHSLPTGVLKNNIINVISRGCVINPVNIVKEIKESCVNNKNLLISAGCPVILPHHLEEDKNKYQGKIGTTAKGIGPAYSEYYSRDNLTIGDLCNNFNSHKDWILKRYQEATKFNAGDAFLTDMIGNLRSCINVLRSHIRNDIEDYLQEAYSNKKNIVLEGAQGWGLDVWSDGYPNVTSSSPSVGGAIISTGLSHKQIDEVIGIAKAYKTRVGVGPFRTELHGEDIDSTRIELGEYGATTSRPRRMGWIDLDELKRACKTNGVDHLLITRIDSVSAFKNGKIGYMANDKENFIKTWKIPEESDVSTITSLQKYVSKVRESTEVANISVSYGPKRNQIKWYKENYMGATK